MFKKDNIIIRIALLIIMIFLTSCGQMISPMPKVSYHKYWAVVYEDNINYVTSFPISSYDMANQKNRHLHYIIIKYNNNKLPTDVSIVGGKNYNTLFNVIIEFHNHKYYLPCYKDRAWLLNKTLVDNLISDIKKNKYFIVINHFEDNSVAKDKYSSEGFEKTYKELNN